MNFKFFGYYYLNKIKNAITNANNATASVKAKPKIPTKKSLSFASGFLDIDVNQLENIFPRPIPTPKSAKTEIPAPIIRAASKSINKLLKFLTLYNSNTKNYIKS